MDDSQVDQDLGLRCNSCGCRDLRVVWVRPIGRNRIKRQRRCRHCGLLKTTIEEAQPEKNNEKVPPV